MARDVARLAALVWCAALVSCDQYALVGVRETQAVDPPAAGQDAAAPAAPDAAMSSTDAAMSNDAGTDGSAPLECPQPDGGIQGDCDPIANTGCSAALAQHCTVNPALPYTGACMFTMPVPPPLGGECADIFPVNGCEPSAACFEFYCRKLCLCDADCPARQCCTGRLEGTGFSVCLDC